MRTYQEFLNEAIKKPKTAFPQSKKTYNTSRAAGKAGEALVKANPDAMEKGTYGVAVLTKSGKYILSWIANQEGSVGAMGGAFLDAGHSSTVSSLIGTYEKKGHEDWNAGSDYVIRWVA